MKENENNSFHTLYQGEHGKEKTLYRLRLEKGLIISLSLLLLIAMIFRRKKETYSTPDIVYSSTLSVTSLQQQTRSGGLSRPPARPRVPVAVEDEYLPEAVTIELQDMESGNGRDDLPAFKNGVEGSGGAYTSPRPLSESIPEYPDELKKKGIEGTVTLLLHIDQNGKVTDVMIVSNTSGSSVLAKKAVAAARKTRFRQPLLKKNQAYCRVQKKYTFKAGS